MRDVQGMSDKWGTENKGLSCGSSQGATTGVQVTAAVQTGYS